MVILLGFWFWVGFVFQMKRNICPLDFSASLSSFFSLILDESSMVYHAAKAEEFNFGLGTCKGKNQFYF